MRPLASLTALVATPARARESGHAHVHLIDPAPIAPVGLIATAAPGGWLASRASKGGR